MMTFRRFASLLGALALCLATSGLQAQESESEDEQAAERADDERSSEEQKAASHLEEAREAYHDGKWYEARQAYKRAFEQAPASSAIRVEAALGRSTLLWEQGEYGTARKYIDEALELARELDRDAIVGRLLLTMGHIEASQGRLGEAESVLQQCVNLAAAQNDPVFGPLCQLNRRLVRKLQGKSAGDEEEYRAALEKLNSVDSPLTVGLSLAKTAELHAKSGEDERAFDLVSRAGDHYAEAGSLPAQARNRMMKARLLQQSGRWEAARVELDGLAEKFRRMGSKPALVDVYGLLGNHARHRGAYAEAMKYYKKGRKAARQIDSPQLLAKADLALCETGAATGKVSLKARCKSAAKAFDATGMPLLTARSHAGLARLRQNSGDLEAARESFRKAIGLLEDEVHASLLDGEIERAYANLCQVEAQMQIKGAQYRCNEALEKLEAAEDVGDPAMRAATHYALGNASARAGDAGEAKKHLKRAASMYLESVEPTDTAMYADTQLRLGTIYKKSGDHEGASKAFRAGLDKLEGVEGAEQSRVALRTQYAQAELALENWEKAASELSKLADEAKAAGDVSKRAWAYSAKARAENHLGETDAAEKSLERALKLAEKAGDEDLAETVRGNLEGFE